MGRFASRAAMTAGAVAFVYWLVGLYESALRDPRFLDGWLLVAAIMFLLLFNIRRRLPALPLGRAALWMQFHLYVGYFAIAMFAIHTAMSWPNGVLEQLLWGLFLTVALSGAFGAFLSWSVPAAIAPQSDQVAFERIPHFRAELGQHATALATGLIEGAGSRAVSDLYAETLSGFFAGPQNLLLHLRGSRRPLKRLCDRIDSVERYLDEEGAATLHSIKNLAIRKDTLDFQYAHQGILKIWLLVHVPASYGLVVASVAHVALIYGFESGAP